MDKTALEMMRIAHDAYHKDARRRAICQQAAARVSRNFDLRDLEPDRRDIDDAALEGAILAMEWLYQQDGELMQLRAENERLREMVTLQTMLTTKPLDAGNGNL